MERFKFTINNQGYSLISILIGIMLMGILLAGSMALLSKAETGTSNASEDMVIDNLSRVMNDISSSIERGGANTSIESINNGIMICTLDPKSGNCKQYQQESTDICIASPVISNEQEEELLEIHGIRHKEGLIQKKINTGVNIKTFNLSNFCRDSDQWENLHSGNDFSVEKFQLCRYDGLNLNSILQNYSNNCQSVLVNRNLEHVPHGQFLISIYQIRPKQLGHTGETFSRILKLYNAPNITTL